MTQGDAQDDATPSSVATRIDEAIETSGLSLREVARRYAGPRSSEKQRENVRRQLIRWKAGTNAPEAASARKLAVVLNQPLDAFVSDRKSRARSLSEISDTAEKLQVALAMTEAMLRRAGLEPVGAFDPPPVPDRLAELEEEVAGLRRSVKTLTSEVRKGFAALQQLQAQQPVDAAPRARRRAKG